MRTVTVAVFVSEFCFSKNLPTLYSPYIMWVVISVCLALCFATTFAKPYKKYSGAEDEDYRDKLWPMVTMPYEIRKEQFTQEEVDLIETAASFLVNSSYLRGLSCIHIIPRTAEPDYVEVAKGRSCSSTSGRQGGKQWIILGPECMTYGMIIREFQHALGYYDLYDIFNTPINAFDFAGGIKGRSIKSHEELWLSIPLDERMAISEGTISIQELYDCNRMAFYHGIGGLYAKVTAAGV